ncbi:MAG: GNAT family N-acetyltransferase [Pseudomonadota bacterium]
MSDLGGNLTEGLHIRPARDTDNPFIELLYRETREDLLLLDAEADFVEELIEMQMKAQSIGYGTAFPNALYYIVEKQGERIGRVTVDFGANEVHVIDLALIRAARSRGYGAAVLKAVQMAAVKVMAPVSLSVDFNNLRAKQFYYRLGFRFEGVVGPAERWAWYPAASVS